MIDQPAPPRRDITFKLGVIMRQMRKAFDRDMAGFGVTRAQWMVIVVAARNPGATQKSIADTLEMTEAATGRLIDKLCADGLLERRPKPDDRRAHCIHITAQAEPLLERLSAIGTHNEGIAFAGLAEAELVQLAGLLDRVYTNLA